MLTPLPADEANGYYFASSALGAFVGPVPVGVFAETLGYNAVNWVAAIANAIALFAMGRARTTSAPDALTS